MAGQTEREWLNLSEAARLLGVHPSTVRTWADKGEVASQRTRGGHRRFRREDLEAWAASHRRGPAPGAALVVQSVLGRARMELSEGQLARLPWYAKMSEAARAAHRATSHRLMNLLKRFLSSASAAEREAMLAEARQMGVDYYQLGQDSRLSLTENVRAFLYFRDFIADSVMNIADAAAPAQPLSELFQLTASFTNEILITLVAAHESKRG